MKRDLENLNYIIPPWDSRYGKLGHLWKRYDFNKIKYSDGGGRVYYFIPPELVVEDYITRNIQIKSILDKDNPWCNWISNRYLFYIEDLTGLSLQEFFDLIVLKSNSKIDRPKCSFCGASLAWSGRFSHGYYGDTLWMNRKYNYCSDSCRTQMMRYDKDYYESFNEAIKDNIEYVFTKEAKTKSAWSRFLNLGPLDDECYFYIARTKSRIFKFGITAYDLETRSYQEMWRGEGYYSEMKPLITRSRIFVANLEALLKLKFDGREYLEEKEIKDLFTYFIKFNLLDLDRKYEFDQLIKISTSTTIP